MLKYKKGKLRTRILYELIKELNQIFSNLKQLIKNINRTNLLTTFGEQQSLADALTERDLLGQERKIYSALLDVSCHAT